MRNPKIGDVCIDKKGRVLTIINILDDDPDEKLYIVLCRGFAKPDIDRWVRNTKGFKRLYNLQEESVFENHNRIRISD